MVVEIELETIIMVETDDEMQVITVEKIIEEKTHETQEKFVMQVD